MPRLHHPQRSVRFQWLDESDEEEEEEDRPLLSSGGLRERAPSCGILLCACAVGALAGALLRYMLSFASSLSGLADAEPAGSGPWTVSRVENRPWPLMMGVLSRESGGEARRQRLRAHYGRVPRVLVRFVVSEGFASLSEEPDLLGVPDGVGGSSRASLTYKSLHFWRLVATLYDARYYLKTDDDAVLHLPLLLSLCHAADTAAAARSGEPPLSAPLLARGSDHLGRPARRSSLRNALPASGLTPQCRAPASAVYARLHASHHAIFLLPPRPLRASHATSAPTHDYTHCPLSYG